MKGPILIVVLLCSVLASCGGSVPSTPAPGPVAVEEIAPRITSVDVEPQIGIDGLTTFSAHVDASDPDGNDLNYMWTASTTTATTAQVGSTKYVVFVAGTTFSPLHVVVSDGRGGTATADSPAFVNAHFSGILEGSIGDATATAVPFFLSVDRDRGTVAGNYCEYGSPEYLCSPTPEGQPGTVDGAGNFRIRFQGSAGDFVLSGSLQTANVYGAYVAAGRVQGGRFDGMAFQFHERDPY